MSSLNKAMVIGNLGADPEVRATQSGTAVANLSVATSRRWTDDAGQQQERTEWHRVTLWGRLAKVAEEYLEKGDRIYVEGRLETREWTDSDGEERRTTEIVASNLVMLGSASGGARSRKDAAPTGAEDDGLPF